MPPHPIIGGEALSRCFITPHSRVLRRY